MDKKINKDARMLSAPEKTIRFLEYLRKNTDKDHTIKLQDIRKAFDDMGLNLGNNKTVNELIKKVADACNFDAEEHMLPQSEWRIVFDDYIEKYGDMPDDSIYIDEENELDIKERDKRGTPIRNLYYAPEFSYEEIDALIEAVRFSKTLTTREAEKMIKTLEEQFTSKYYKRGARAICKTQEKACCDRNLLRRNLLVIQQAIEKGVQIEYQFNGYSHDKKLVPQGDYKRKVSPYYIVADNGRYYLLGANERYKNTLILRIDLMTEVNVLERNDAIGKKEVPRIPKRDVLGLPQNWDDSFPLKHLNMSYDPSVKITLRVKSEKSEQNDRKHKSPDYTFLYDHFGDNYTYRGMDENDSDYDIITVECSAFGMVNFALQYVDKLEVLEPASVREEIQKKVRMLQERYLIKE